MGVFWLSQAEIVNYEPQRLKKLIEQIFKHQSSEDSNDEVAPVHNLRVEGNSVFFDSEGYGCYGVESENPHTLLFEKLFEQFDKPLVCFEYVSPCQSQGYYFSST